MPREFDRKIVLEDGSEFYGYGFGGTEERVCELVFDTSMVGYQEIVSDPTYTHQMVVMTYPIIGNYGMADDDFESRIPTLGALVVRDYNDSPSNFRYTKTLGEILEENNIPAISGIDTRMLARKIRDCGTMLAVITDASVAVDDALAAIKAAPVRTDSVELVSCKKRWYSRTSNHKYNVVAVDCGIKLNTIKGLNAHRCNVTVVPYTTTAEEIAAMSPDGVFLSNGPGNPEDAQPVIELVRKLRGSVTIFGTDLGHQIIALAYGAKIYKMKFGHHGGNHPVRNVKTGKIEMAPQNHCYAVDTDSVAGTGLEITHVNVLDGTVEGLMCEKDRTFCVQHQPESAPGTQDSAYLFARFIEYMKEAKENA